MTNTYWEFDGYTVEKEIDILRFENNEGDVIGYVTVNDESIIEELDNGAYPIEEGWEDGAGNTINIFGWGREAPKTLEQALDRVRAIYEVDGESAYSSKFGTYYESKDDLLDSIDLELFEELFEMSINDVVFPIVTFETEATTDPEIYTEIHEVLDNAEGYFTKK